MDVSRLLRKALLGAGRAVRGQRRHRLGPSPLARKRCSGAAQVGAVQYPRSQSDVAAALCVTAPRPPAVLLPPDSPVDGSPTSTPRLVSSVGAHARRPAKEQVRRQRGTGTPCRRLPRRRAGGSHGRQRHATAPPGACSAGRPGRGSPGEVPALPPWRAPTAQRAGGGTSLDRPVGRRPPEQSGEPPTISIRSPCWVCSRPSNDSTPTTGRRSPPSPSRRSPASFAGTSAMPPGRCG